MAGRAALPPEQYACWWQQVGLLELRQILFWRWDPIGVAFAFPRTAAEYDACARVLLSRLETGVSAGEIAAYLDEVETGAMGLRASSEETRLEIGERIVAWMDESIDAWIESSPSTPADAAVPGLLGELDPSSDDDPTVSWFAVRRVFRSREVTYEERVTLQRASSFEEADRLADAEAVGYAEVVGARVLAFAQLYRLGEAPVGGAEVFSLMRDSDLEPDAYLDHFFNDGEERQRTLE